MSLTSLRVVNSSCHVRHVSVLSMIAIMHEIFSCTRRYQTDIRQEDTIPCCGGAERRLSLASAAPSQTPRRILNEASASATSKPVYRICGPGLRVLKEPSNPPPQPACMAGNRSLVSAVVRQQAVSNVLLRCCPSYRWPKTAHCHRPCTVEGLSHPHPRR